MTEPSGRWTVSTTAGESVRAFVPDPLPPHPLPDLSALYAKLDRANQAMGRLDGISRLLPDTKLFLYLYVQKEALLSSQIEGTQSSLADLLLFEAKQPIHVEISDVEEVSNYVAAVNHGLERLRSGFPLSLRLIQEVHAILLRGGRGARMQPGEFRQSQNWIGGSRPGNAVFVPPSVEDLQPALYALELFLHDEEVKLPTLVRAALVHVQFETIHPFLDGNGRLGRLLITLMLCADGVLSDPILYLSLYLKQNRQTYYDLLNRVRMESAWDVWLEFFLDGVSEVSAQATDSAQRILDLFTEDRSRIQALGRRASTVLRVHDHLQRQPYTDVAAATDATGLSQPAVAAALRDLEALGIVRETTGRQRDRVFEYTRYMATLSEGAEPIPP